MSHEEDSSLQAFRTSSLGFQLFAGGGVAADAFQQAADGSGWLGPDAQPVIHSIDLDLELLVFGGDRVEPTEFLNHAAIAGRSLVHRIKAIERTMATTHTL